MLETFCEWRPSPVFPSEYLVSNDGRVYSIRSRKEIKPSKDKSGYLYYVLCVGGNRKTVKAHRLVATAFIPNVDNKPTVDHKNADRTDNRAENLRWASLTEQWENPYSVKNHYCGSKKAAEKLKGRPARNRKRVAIYKNGKLVCECESLNEACKRLKINNGHASECANGKRNTASGYTVVWLRK